MGDCVSIQDAVLERAGSSLVAAATGMLNGLRQPPIELATVSGIGNEIAEVMLGLRTGSLALADAAKTATGAISAVMYAGGELDALIAAELHTGFAISRA